MGNFCCESVKMMSKVELLTCTMALLPVVSSDAIRLLEQKEKLTLNMTQPRDDVSHFSGSHCV